MNILLFGDSFLGRFNRDLIQLLESKISDSTVFNTAAGGWNSDDGVKRVDYISQLKPDVAIISFGANDTAPWKDGVVLSRFNYNMQYMIRSFPTAKVVVMLCPAVNLKDESQTKEFNNSLSLYNKSLIKICNEYGATYIDANLLLKDLDSYHEDDGLHINKLAYDRIIQKISEIVK